MNINSIDTNRLCHLPLVMSAFRRMKMDEVIDHAIPQDPRSKVSASECVATILCGIFSGNYSLWRLRERLAPYDMATVMQDETYCLNDFPEERLAKVLDDIYLADPDKLMTGVSLQMIRHYHISTSFVHFDTTSLSFYGGYESEDPFSSCDGIPPPPKITYGYSKDKRGDLKQLLYGMLVSQDGGVPLMGKSLDGNLSDSVAAADFFARLRHLVADPREVCCVADSKGWTEENLGIIESNGMRLLSRLPKTKALHKTICARAAKTTDVQELILPPRTKKGKPRIYRYTGHDATDVATMHHEDGSTQSSAQAIAVRVLHVLSLATLDLKMKTIERQKQKDLVSVEKEIRQYRRTVYACETDAKQAAARYREQTLWPTLNVIPTVVFVENPKSRKPGRPPRYYDKELAAKPHWSITFKTKEVAPQVMRQRLKESATFLLIRNKQDGWDITDEEMLLMYKQQYRVEHGFAWLKSGGPINPVFLNTPHRISSLCLIYCFGLMIWNVIQRTVRKELKDRQAGLPYYRGKLSDNITTRFLFELFPQVAVNKIAFSDGSIQRHLSGFNEYNQLACDCLGVPKSAYTPVVPH